VVTGHDKRPTVYRNLSPTHLGERVGAGLRRFNLPDGEGPATGRLSVSGRRFSDGTSRVGDDGPMMARRAWGERRFEAWVGVVVLVVSLLAAGCSETASPSVAALQPGRTWQLVEVRTGSNTLSPIPPTRASTSYSTTDT
jgi:hypothetical protein